jgi:predicted RNA-binding protein with PUA-like domain
MRAMVPGDLAFFYHSNTSPPGIVGLMEVVETGLVDPSQFDPGSKYHDPRATREKPRWDCVRLKHRRSFAQLLSLETLREQFEAEELAVVRRGNRLSILPVSEPVALRLYALLGESP